jgi:hypothetical protein
MYGCFDQAGQSNDRRAFEISTISKKLQPPPQWNHRGERALFIKSNPWPGEGGAGGAINIKKIKRQANRSIDSPSAFTSLGFRALSAAAVVSTSN